MNSFLPDIRDLELAITNFITKSENGNQFSDELGYKCVSRNNKWWEDITPYIYAAINLTFKKLSFSGRLKVLDLGCGWGTALRRFPSLNTRGILHTYFQRIGIEFREEYQELFKLVVPYGKFILQDLNKVTVTQLRKINPHIIYLYNPLHQEYLEKKLEEKVSKLNKAIIIGPTFKNIFRETHDRIHKEIFIPKEIQYDMSQL